MKLIKQSGLMLGLVITSVNTSWAFMNNDVPYCNNYNVVIFNATGSPIYASLNNLGTMSHGDYPQTIATDIYIPNDTEKTVGQITNAHAYNDNFWSLWGDLTVWGELQVENYYHNVVFDEQIGKAHYSLSNTSSGGYFATPVTMHPLAMGYKFREFGTNHCLESNATNNQPGEYYLLLSSTAVG